MFKKEAKLVIPCMNPGTTLNHTSDNNHMSSVTLKHTFIYIITRSSTRSHTMWSGYATFLSHVSVAFLFFFFKSLHFLPPHLHDFLCLYVANSLSQT